MSQAEIDGTYNRWWMEKRSKPNVSQRRGAESMVKTIVRDLDPKNVLDLGCGSCNFANKFKDLGCKVCAVDGSSYAEEFAGPDINFVHHDLTKELFLGNAFDVVLCVEVIEHIEAKYEDTILQAITKHADCWIVFTGAKIGQGGIGHVNCREKEHWIEKFANLGFQVVESNRWETEWRKEKVRWWYVDNLLGLRPSGVDELKIIPQKGK